MVECFPSPARKINVNLNLWASDNVFHQQRQSKDIFKDNLESAISQQSCGSFQWGLELESRIRVLGMLIVVTGVSSLLGLSSEEN